MHDYRCPECGSGDLDVAGLIDADFECQECGWHGAFSDLEPDPDDVDDWTPPDFGPPGSGAVIIEYEVGTYEEPW